MIIYRTPNVLFVQDHAEAEDCVKIGVLGVVALRKRGVWRPQADEHKPHADYTIGELEELLARLERLP